MMVASRQRTSKGALIPSPGNSFRGSVVASLLLTLQVALIAVLFAGFVRTFLVQAIRIPSRSMEPTLQVGDFLLVNRFVYGSARFQWESEWLPLRPVRGGDLAVFRSKESPSLRFVKRCVATEFQTVRIRNKTLWVDGVRQNEGSMVQHSDPRTYRDSPFLEPAFRARDQMGPITVPPRSFFALGDHRDISDDSRFWGSVPTANLKGRILVRYWHTESGIERGAS